MRRCGPNEQPKRMPPAPEVIPWSLPGIWMVWLNSGSNALI